MKTVIFFTALSLIFTVNAQANTATLLKVGTKLKTTQKTEKAGKDGSKLKSGSTTNVFTNVTGSLKAAAKQAAQGSKGALEAGKNINPKGSAALLGLPAAAAGVAANEAVNSSAAPGSVQSAQDTPKILQSVARKGIPVAGKLLEILTQSELTPGQVTKIEVIASGLAAVCLGTSSCTEAEAHSVLDENGVNPNEVEACTI